MSAHSKTRISSSRSTQNWRRGRTCTASSISQMMVTYCGSGLFLLQRSSLGLGRSSSVLPSENLRYSTVCSWPCLAFFYFCFWEEAQSSLILDQHLDGLLQLLLSQCQFHKSLRRRLVLNWIIPLDSELTHSLCLFPLLLLKVFFLFSSAFSCNFLLHSATLLSRFLQKTKTSK